MLQIKFKKAAQFVFCILLPNLPYAIAFAEGVSGTGTAKQTVTGGKNLLFPTEFLLQDAEFVQESNSQIIANTNNIKNEYLSTLKGTSAFNGVYFTGGYSKNINDETNEYFYGLEWELYDNGSYAAERQLKKRKLETHLQFLQQLRQTYTQHKNSQINFIHQIESRLDLYITEMQSKIIRPQLIKAQQQLKKGFITQIEYREWELRASNVQSKIGYLKNNFFVHLDRELFNLLNNIESKNIKDINTLFDSAKQKSIAIKVQNLFSTRSKFLPTWKDNLSLSFYLEQQYRRTQTAEKLVGMRLRVPLGADSNRKKLIHLDQKIYHDKIVAIKKNIKQKLRVSLNQFHFLQQRVKYLLEKGDLLSHKINTLKIQKKAGLPSLDYTPEKDIPLYQLQYIDILNNALRTRLKLYATIVELEELVVPKKLMDLFE